ncbi:MAG: FHA domain-containing protein [Kofleriaceae bacterium]
MSRAPNPGAPRVSPHVVPKAQVTYDADGEESTTNDAWEEPSTTTEQGEVAERIRSFRAELARRSEDAIRAEPDGTSDIVTADPEARVTLPRPRQSSPDARATAPRTREPSPRRVANSLGTSEEPTVEDQRANAALNAIVAPRSVATLAVTDGSDIGKTFELQPGKTYTIGRAIDNDVVLTDISVSRKHFDLRFDDGAWQLRDRGSGNGTLINGIVEDHAVRLANGDVIEIGNTLFRFDAPDAPKRPAPPLAGDPDEDLATVAGKRRPTELQHGHDVPPLPPPEPRLRAVTRPPPPPAPRARTPSSAPPFSPEPPAPIPAPAPVAAPAPLVHQFSGARHVLPSQSPTLLGEPRPAPAPLLPPAPVPVPATTRGGPAMMQYSYPPAAALPSQLAPTQGPSFPPSMLVMPNAQVRSDPSTALVPPTPYYPVALPPPPQQYIPPTLSQRTKVILAGAGLTLFAAIATVAVIKGSGSDAEAVTKPRPTAPAATTKAPAKTPINATAQQATPPKREEPPKPATTAAVPPPPAAKPVPPPPLPAVTEKPAPPPAAPVVASAPPASAQADRARLERERSAALKAERDRKRAEQQDKTAARRPKETRRPGLEDEDAVQVEDEDDEEEAEPKRVASDLSGIKSKADEQYRAKNFSGAATTLTKAAEAADEDEARKLKSLASKYAEFGKAYNVGMGPATPVKDAFAKLMAARKLDSSVGGEFTTAIDQKLDEVAPRAAATFIANKDYERAFSAAQVNAQSPTAQSVMKKLQEVAGDLYRTAEKQMSSDEDSAREKLRLVRKIVDSKSSWHQKATKLLGG